MNNMLGDCYAAVVIEKISQKELEVMLPEDSMDKDKVLDEITVV